MTADIMLPAPITISSTYDESTPYIAVPAAMWSGDANMYGILQTDGTHNGYVSARVTSGTIVGNFIKIPLYNEWSGTIAITGFRVSLYVKDSAISESDIQNIAIYYNECPE